MMVFPLCFSSATVKILVWTNLIFGIVVINEFHLNPVHWLSARIRALLMSLGTVWITRCQIRIYPRVG
jgi:hypothetical protein